MQKCKNPSAECEISEVQRGSAGVKLITIKTAKRKQGEIQQQHKRPAKLTARITGIRI